MHNEFLKLVTEKLPKMPKMPKNGVEFRILMSSLVLPLAPLLGSMLFCPFDAHWYSKIRKPASAPPKWVFPIVWTALYLMIGYASNLAWEATPLGGGCLCSSSKIKAYFQGAPGIFWAHMVLNYGWSWVFFKFHCMGSAAVVSAALTAAAGFVAYRFYLLDKMAGYLMIPYVLWLTFATKLGYDFYVVNKPRKMPEMLKKNK